MEKILFSVSLGRFMDALGLMILGVLVLLGLIGIYFGFRPKQEVEFRRYTGPSLFQRFRNSRLSRWLQDNFGVSDEIAVPESRFGDM